MDLTGLGRAAGERVKTQYRTRTNNISINKKTSYNQSERGARGWGGGGGERVGGCAEESEEASRARVLGGGVGPDPGWPVAVVAHAAEVADGAAAVDDAVHVTARTGVLPHVVLVA